MKLFNLIKQQSKITNQIIKSFESKEFRATKESKSPKRDDKTKYIGIEIEMFINTTRDVFRLMVADAGLSKYINVGTDGSLENDWLDMYDYIDSRFEDLYEVAIPEMGAPKNAYSETEVRLLIPEKQLTKVMTKFGKLMKTVNARVNDSCGLHVHLDMRNRDVVKCANRLLASQDLLFNMVPASRKDNDYCSRNNIDKITFSNINDGYNTLGIRGAVNLQAYREHKTIEIRLHEGSVNTNDIINWTKLLINIADNTKLDVTQSSPMKVGSLPRGVKIYANKRYKKYKGPTKGITKDSCEDDYEGCGCGDPDCFG